MLVQGGAGRSFARCLGKPGCYAGEEVVCCLGKPGSGSRGTAASGGVRRLSEGMCSMDCRERILSNNYYDVITDFPLRFFNGYDLCSINVENLYNIVYISKADVQDSDDYFYNYRSVPKLYGLMQEEGTGGSFDPNSLIVSGITQVQRAPLELTGRGVVICMIDTGDCVIVLPD